MPQDTIILAETGSDADCYTSNRLFPNERNTNFNNNELNVGVFNIGGFWRTAIGLNIASRYPAGVIFDDVTLQMTGFVSSGSGGTVEAQKIPSPIVLDAQVTHNDRTSFVSWTVPGIDVESPPPPIVTAPMTVSQQLLAINSLHQNFQDGYDNEGGVVNLRIRKVPETGGVRWSKFRSSAYSVQADRPTYFVTYHVPILLGYKLYLKHGTPPNPVVDQPVATVDSSSVSAVLDMNTLGLMANDDYFGLVSPFNAVGPAVTSAPFRFKTDGTGLPLLVPAPVSRLAAVPLVGGNVRVSWSYDEPNPIAMADTFEIEVFNDTSSFPFSVPHASPRRTYTRDLTVGSDGLFQVRVKSDKGGLSQANVSPVPVMLDATPPIVVPVTLSAV